MNSQNSPIGLFDSGIGGLTVLNELKIRFPDEQFVYLGDSARNPYGPKSRETILRYSSECAEFLYKKGIKLLVIACNTSSSVAIPTLKGMFDCPIIGMINPVVELALQKTQSGSVAVIGTRATIGSLAYQRALRDGKKDIEVYPIACPLFVPLVEEGIFEGPIVDGIVDRYLRPLKESRVDTLILGCTHYPLLRDAISRYFDRPINFIDCGFATGMYLENTLAKEGVLRTSDAVRETLTGSDVVTEIGGASNSSTGDRFFVTDGLDRFEELARLILGKTPETREQIQAF